MTKKEAERLLLQGKKIGEIFDLVPGQDCMIYKGEWPDDPETSDEIIYIPDIDLNDLEDDDMPTSEKINFMYTAQDFLNQTGGNIAAAKDLFDFVDWQNPNVQDLMDCTDDDEAKEIYGQTWEEMLDEPAKQVRTIQVDPVKSSWINKIMHTEPRDESECFGEDSTYVQTADFNRHISMDIKICGVKYDANELSNLPWTEAVLFYDGCEVACSDVGDEFFGPWTLPYKGNTYTVIVEEAAK